MFSTLTTIHNKDVLMTNQNRPYFIKHFLLAIGMVSFFCILCSDDSMKAKLILWNELGEGLMSNKLMYGISNISATKDKSKSTFTINFDYDKSTWPTEIPGALNVFFLVLDENGIELTRLLPKERVATNASYEKLSRCFTSANRNAFGDFIILKPTGNILTYQISKKDIDYAKFICMGFFFPYMPNISNTVDENYFKDNVSKTLIKYGMKLNESAAPASISENNISSNNQVQDKYNISSLNETSAQWLHNQNYDSAINPLKTMDSLLSINPLGNPLDVATAYTKASTLSKLCLCYYHIGEFKCCLNLSNDLSTLMQDRLWTDEHINIGKDFIGRLHDDIFKYKIIGYLAYNQFNDAIGLSKKWGKGSLCCSCIPDINGKGYRINKICPNSPAFYNHLREGDLITAFGNPSEINDSAIDNKLSFDDNILSKFSPGTNVNITIIRDTARISGNITIGVIDSTGYKSSFSDNSDLSKSTESSSK